MDKKLFKQESEYTWVVEPHGKMRVPAVLYADAELLEDMEDKVYQQLCNVATLPGIVGNAYAMPDAHWGYGFPIGGVAAFDADEGGVISAGGVGFDISCGVRTLKTGLSRSDIELVKRELADALFEFVPSGLGSVGQISLNTKQMDNMLAHGAKWAIENGYGWSEDVDLVEENGCIAGADPSKVSDKAKTRQRREMGTLGSGNHYLEVQHVTTIYNQNIANRYGIKQGDVLVSIHCGSRGLGHQIGTEYLHEMALAAKEYGIDLPDRELACAPIDSEIGQNYLGAMRAGINCALANRQIITHLTRQAFSHVLPGAILNLLYDVSHNTCKVEKHEVDGEMRELYVHRKGATRAYGPGHPEVPEAYRDVGQPVLIGGSMGTSSYILAGADASEQGAFSSACHGAGRSMSRHQAKKHWSGRALIEELASRGIIVRTASFRGVAEEAPGAYKDVSRVVDAADRANLATKVASLEPIVCIKG